MASTSPASEMSSAKRHNLDSLTHFPAFWMLLLPLLAAAATTAAPTTATPTPTSTSTPTADRRRCEHKGIAELIRTSPVIVKALAARIFTDAELGEQPATGASASVWQTATILITLTPETIYKGASLLKMANGAAAAGDGDGGDGTSGNSDGNFGSGVRRNGFGSVSGSSGWNGGSGAAYQYEGQLNATLQPLHCFDANMLKMLPTELIAFGKLLPASAVTGTGYPAVTSRQMQMQRPSLGSPLAGDKDVLHISVNGLHRWTPQFENHIWKHLGWDDWSDFTLCSVTCGKGVQQRFRRCLLDNPLVDINMNMNLDDDDDDEQEEKEEEAEQQDELEQAQELNVEDTEVVADEANNDVNVAAATATATASFNADNNEVLSHDEDDANEHEGGDSEDVLLMMQPAAAGDFQQPMMTLLHRYTQTTARTTAKATATSTLTATAGLTSDDNEARGTGVRFVPTAGVARNDRRWTRTNNQQHKHKKRKAAKSLAFSTLLCEGYNIEQRNCNSFECSDDISDLLKFYKKLPAPVNEELPTTTNNDSVPIGLPADLADLTTAVSMGVTASSTPSNMGYIRSWRNMLNFTLMITLRAKNDTKNASTIFSIRNVTHNLYLEACKDGLRLYLERDNTTEMLPVKFNLYDYRWHQVAISIQNGDFISIYVDCLWTNSFVVSKRLFTLPLDADVEIGRGFNGELQQLLVLPEHQERLQCSNKRTSINEVKRYIIDTFIEDYGSN